MPKYKMRIWFTVSRSKEIEVELKNREEAEKYAWETALSSDTSDWEECDDSNFEIDIERI